jgi:hypothetical protein
MKSKRSTSSLESEDSVSDLREPDLFGQLPSASESRSAKPSSESIGPASRSTTMSEPSQQMDLEELTSSAADSHANPGVWPGSVKAQKMTETSGRKWLGLLESYNLDGSLAKMCEDLLTSHWASSAAFLTWKASATKPSHLLFQLAVSMPRTVDQESGLWATPVSSPRGGRRKASIERGGGVTLQQQVKLWPTPHANCHTGAGKHGNGGNNLQTAVEMVPTLAARDYRHPNKKSFEERGGGKKGEQLPNHVGGALNPAWVEWLMGYEIGHTDLGHWEMPLSRKSSKKSEEQ